ncbi:MAG: hypothetical protein U0U70_15445 [Chitinophagaceae bacterium]
MKKFVIAAAAACFALTGCLETTQEITLKEDGSGTVTSVSDMGALLDLVKSMGAGGDMEKAGDKVMDTTIALAEVTEKITDASAEEKQLLAKGSMGLKMNLKENTFSTSLNFPFTHTDQISVFSRLTNKVVGTLMKDEMASSPMGSQMGGDIPPISSIEDYYILKFEKGEIKRTLNKEKYASVSSDEYLAGLKQAGAMGLEGHNTCVINLPKPAQKLEGKNAVLSDDKMKVTIKAGLDEFFETPEALEFKVKW